MLGDDAGEILYDNRAEAAFQSVRRRRRNRVLANAALFAGLLLVIAIVMAPVTFASRSFAMAAVWVAASSFPIAALVLGAWVATRESLEIRVLTGGVWLSRREWIPAKRLEHGTLEEKYKSTIVRVTVNGRRMPILSVPDYLIANPSRFRDALVRIVSDGE